MLISLSIFSRFIYVIVYNRISLHFKTNNIPLYVLHFVYPFIHLWTLELLPSFWLCEQCCSEYWCKVSVWVPVHFFWVYTFVWDCWVIRWLCVQLCEELFTAVAVLFYTSSAMLGASIFSVSLPTLIILLFSIIISVIYWVWNDISFCVMICISLRTHEVEHLYLLVICVSLEK